MKAIFLRAILTVCLLTPSFPFAQNTSSASAAFRCCKRACPALRTGRNPNPRVPMNGLEGPEIKPWHMKVNYQIFNPEGTPQNSGTYEECWMSEKTLPAQLHQQWVYPDRLRYRAWSLSQRQSSLAEFPGNENTNGPDPTPSSRCRSRDRKLKISERNMDQVQLQCVVLQPKDSNIVRVYNASAAYPYIHYCFDRQHPMLRFASQGNGIFDTLYNHIILFQGRYIAREVRVASQQRAQLILRVDTLETLAREYSRLPTPAGCSRAQWQSASSRGVARYACAQALFDGKLFFHSPHRCPGNSGFTNHYREGWPCDFRPSAEWSQNLTAGSGGQCVRKYEFRPFLVQGQPVEMEGKLEVNMAISSMPPE